MGRLDAWELPRQQRPFEWFGPALQWGAAALLMLGIGFAFGRLSGSDALAEKLRARLEPQLREALYQEMAQMVRQEVGRSSSAVLLASGDQVEKLLADYNTINETRRAEELQRLYVALKKQLDTVAINTQQELVQLATYQQPTIETGNH
jgi:hypothetical protein